MKNTTIKKTSVTLKVPPKRNPLVALVLLRVAPDYASTPLPRARRLVHNLVID